MVQPDVSQTLCNVVLIKLKLKLKIISTYLMPLYNINLSCGKITNIMNIYVKLA